jgi:hypothetical protein
MLIYGNLCYGESVVCLRLFHSILLSILCRYSAILPPLRAMVDGLYNYHEGNLLFRSYTLYSILNSIYSHYRYLTNIQRWQLDVLVSYRYQRGFKMFVFLNR